MSSGYTRLSAAGAVTWKDPVSTMSALPPISNTLGDARVATDTSTIYIWNGSAWVPVSGGGGGGSVTSVTGTAPISTTNPTTTPNISITLANTTTDGYLSSTDWNTFNSKAPGTGTANTLAGFDNSGNFESIPNWSITPENGIDVNTSVDELNANFNQWTVNVDPSAPTTGLYRNIFQLDSDLDPNNTGNQMGDGISGGGAGLINLNINHTSSGEVGHIDVINGNSDLGDGTTAGHNDNFGIHSHGVHVANNYTVDTFTGFGLFPIFDLGSNLGNLNAFTLGATFNGATTGFIQSLALFPNFGASSVTAHYHAIENGGNATAGAQVTDYIGINTYLNNVTSTTHVGYNFNSSGITTSEWQGLNIGASTTTVSTLATGININMTGGSFTSVADAIGLHIDLSNLVPTSGNPPTGIEVNEGITNLYFTQNLKDYTGGAPQISHLIGGVIQVLPGSPVTSPFIINNLSLNQFLVQDDIGPNPAIPALGVTGFAASGQVQVTLGKTVDTFNEIVAAKTVPSFPGGGGTITNYNMVNSIGVINAGGTIVITNLTGFNVDANFSSMATNAWGVKVNDTNANNWFAKNVVIGGVTALPTGAFALDVTGDAVIAGNLGLETETFINQTTPATPAAGKTTIFVDSADKHTKQIDDTGTVTDLAGAASFTDVTLSGKLNIQTRTVTTTYSVDGSGTDNVIFADTTGGSFTITLPTPTAGRLVTIKDPTASFFTNNLTVSPNASELIDGASSYVANADRASISLVSDGTNWFII